MKPTDEQVKIAGLYLKSIAPAGDLNAEYALTTILAALESAQAEIIALEKQVDELQTELSKWPT